jgi:tetratricopeptide (TPR) repeat protein
MLAIAFVWAIPSAHAQDRATRERAAKLACLTGDSAAGAKMLAELFIDTKDPNYLFNQARCYEQNNRFEEAVRSFREYLRKATDATASDRADAEEHIADCRALLGKTVGAGTATSSEAPAPARAVVAPPTAAVATGRDTAGDASATGSGLRTAGILTAAVGVATVVAGVVLNLQYNQTIDDMQTHYRATTESSNKTKKTLAFVGYGAGAACLAGGALLYYLGWRAGQATILPTAVAGNAGLALVGGF